MILKGYEAKEIFHKSSGVLFYDGQTLAFIDCKTLDRTYKFNVEADQPGEKKVVIGRMFDLVKMLKNDQEYEFEVVGRFVVFRNVNTNQVELVIEGEVSY
jgi:hypothetical protein